MRTLGWPRPRLALLAGLLAVVAAVALPGRAGAEGTFRTQTLPAAHTLCDNAITRRLSDLQQVESDVNASLHVTATDRSSLDAIVSATSTGLMALETKINADTTLVTLRADCASIVTGYRVYLLVDPQARLVVGADRALAASAALGNLAGLLQTTITQKQGAGKSVTAAQSELAQLMGDIQAAQDLASSVPGQIVPLTPDGYPGNRPTLVKARGELATAESDLTAGVQAAQQAAADLNATG